MANFEAFCWNFSSSINLFFLKSDLRIWFSISQDYIRGKHLNAWDLQWMRNISTRITSLKKVKKYSIRLLININVQLWWPNEYCQWKRRIPFRKTMIEIIILQRTAGCFKYLFYKMCKIIQKNVNKYHYMWWRNTDALAFFQTKTSILKPWYSKQVRQTLFVHYIE